MFCFILTTPKKKKRLPSANHFFKTIFFGVAHQIFKKKKADVFRDALRGIKLWAKRKKEFLGGGCDPPGTKPIGIFFSFFFFIYIVCQNKKRSRHLLQRVWSKKKCFVCFFVFVPSSFCFQPHLHTTRKQKCIPTKEKHKNKTKYSSLVF